MLIDNNNNKVWNENTLVCMHGKRKSQILDTIHGIKYTTTLNQTNISLIDIPLKVSMLFLLRIEFPIKIRHTPIRELLIVDVINASLQNQMCRSGKKSKVSNLPIISPVRLNRQFRQYDQKFQLNMIGTREQKKLE